MPRQKAKIGTTEHLRQCLILGGLKMARTNLADVAKSLQVSRQAVSAVAAGEMTSRRIRAALARRLGMKYEALWGQTPARMVRAATSRSA